MKLMSETLKETRLAKSLTLKAVTQAIGIATVYLSNIENGKNVPLDGAILYKLAGFYGIDFTELLKSAYNQKYLQTRAKYPELIEASHV